MSKYTLVTGRQLDTDSSWEDLYNIAKEQGIDPYEYFSPWSVPEKADIFVPKQKRFLVGHIYQSESGALPYFVSAVFVTGRFRGAPCFSFDIAVDSEHRRKGFASKLVDAAIAEYERLKEKNNSNIPYCVEVVDEHMKGILERKGFSTYKTDTYAHNGWKTKWFMRK